MNKLVHLMKGIAIKNLSAHQKRDPFLWLFGEWFGERCCDNALYLANYVSETHPEIHVVWAAKHHADLSPLNKKIVSVRFGTEAAIKIYQKAGVVFMNQGYQDFSEEGFNYFGNAVTVNLWHGVMWKHIGHDGSDRSGTLFDLYKKLMDYAFGATKYIALSEDYAKICESAFGAMASQIIRCGYPRNAIFYKPDLLRQAKTDLVELLSKEIGLKLPCDIKIITYMPTFRDNTDEAFSFEQLSSNEKLMNCLERNNAFLVQKAHFVSERRHKTCSRKAKAKRIITLNQINAQSLLAATDLLITDYSSCFFDYLILDRPIVHFIYDYDYYAIDDRGLYYKKEDVVCGDIASTTEELLDAIINNIEVPKKNHQLREIRLKQFMTYESPDSCELLYHCIHGD